MEPVVAEVYLKTEQARHHVTKILEAWTDSGFSLRWVRLHSAGHSRNTVQGGRIVTSQLSDL